MSSPWSMDLLLSLYVESLFLGCESHSRPHRTSPPAPRSGSVVLSAAAHRPMWYERPFGLWMGDGCGSVSAHSYHTRWREALRQKAASTRPPSGTRTGVRSGMKSGNHENMPTDSVLGSVEMCTASEPSSQSVEWK